MHLEQFFLKHPNGADVAVDVTPAHQPDEQLAENLQPRVGDLPGPVGHPEPGHEKDD